MSTATRVPETSRITGDELDGSDARTALRRFGRRRLAVESFRRFRYGDGFSHSRAVGFQLVLALIPLTIAMAGLSSAAHAEGIGLVIRDTLLSLTPGSSDEVVRETLDQGLEQARGRRAGPVARPGHGPRGPDHRDGPDGARREPHLRDPAGSTGAAEVHQGPGTGRRGRHPAGPGVPGPRRRRAGDRRGGTAV